MTMSDGSRHWVILEFIRAGLFCPPAYRLVAVVPYNEKLSLAANKKIAEKYIYKYIIDPHHRREYEKTKIGVALVPFGSTVLNMAEGNYWDATVSAVGDVGLLLAAPAQTRRHRCGH